MDAKSPTKVEVSKDEKSDEKIDSPELSSKDQ